MDLDDLQTLLEDSEDEKNRTFWTGSPFNSGDDLNPQQGLCMQKMHKRLEDDERGGLVEVGYCGIPEVFHEELYPLPDNHEFLHWDRLICEAWEYAEQT